MLELSLILLLDPHFKSSPGMNHSIFTGRYAVIDVKNYAFMTLLDQFRKCTVWSNISTISIPVFDWWLSCMLCQHLSQYLQFQCIQVFPDLLFYWVRYNGRFNMFIDFYKILRITLQAARMRLRAFDSTAVTFEGKVGLKWHFFGTRESF